MLLPVTTDILLKPQPNNMESKIKASELRIGNLVQMNGIYISVTHILPLWIEGDYSPFGYIEYDKLEPIELTEQVLLKCGFKFSGVVQSLGYFRLIYEDGGKLFFYSHAMLQHEIKYLHQLQNLYFACTGLELEFKA